jgi:hypothetical protein
VITEGLIAIGILALIAALFLLGGRAKSREANQHVRRKRAANKHPVALAEPSESAKILTPFPVTQAPFPISTADKQFTDFVEFSESAKAIEPFSVPQVPSPISTVNKSLSTLIDPLEMMETLTHFDLYAPEDHAQDLAKSSQATQETQASFPMQTTIVTQTLVQEIQPRQTQVQQATSDQAQVPVALNEQSTAKLHNDLPEAQAQSSLASKMAPLPPAKPISRSLRRPPSIEEQMAALTTDAWALQQQAAEIICRLSYLSACLEHSPASAPDEPDDNSNHNS